MANFEFKPFDKVLVRNCIMGHKAYWIPALYGFKSKDMKHYLTSAGWQEECIPYEGNEEYLGTTKDYVDKVPMFKVGDWICHTVYKKPLLIVEDLGEGDFRTEPKSIITAKEFREGFYRLWTIQDAKDGDVLRIRNLTFIFQEITNNNVCHKDAVVAYCSYQDYDNSFGVCGPDCITDLEVITPAAQKQHDLLFQKMKEAGYEWDAEKKELKKVEQKPAECPLHCEMPNWADCPHFEQKTEWSEDDKIHLHSIESTIEYCKRESAEAPLVVQNYNKDLNWLKSLKDRVLPQPKQELSDEDKKLIDDTCHLINTLASGYGEKVTEPITFSGTQMIASIKDRLRALVDNRPRSYWKPSEGQMVALNCAITAASDNFVCLNVKDLESLYGDLKKLTE